MYPVLGRSAPKGKLEAVEARRPVPGCESFDLRGGGFSFRSGGFDLWGEVSDLRLEQLAPSGKPLGLREVQLDLRGGPLDLQVKALDPQVGPWGCQGGRLALQVERLDLRGE
jgi:hypothetical protein